MTKEVAINVLKSHYHKNPRTSYSLMVKQATEMAIEALKERKTGKWIECDRDYQCTRCDDFISKYIPWYLGGLPNYCPNCGAKMEVDE